MSASAFIDSNVVLSLLSADAEKANRAEAVVAAGGVVSVQVLNEVTNVMRRKLGLPWSAVDEVLGVLRALCPAQTLTQETHDCGRYMAERYGFSIYDAMIVASALLAGCETLYSEDMQDGLLIEKRLRICNPFATDR